MIEPLESRIAPAAVFTVQDVDGDLITITTSKGTNAQLFAIINPFLVLKGDGAQLQKIDFSADAATFAGTNLTVTAKKAPGGDGFANVGYIDAGAFAGGTKLDLGVIKVAGDLGVIDAGDGISATSAIKSLNVRSMGIYGTATGAINLESLIDGRVDKLTVKGDVKGAYFHVTDSGGSNGTIGSVSVGGSVIGGAGNASGVIFCPGDMGPVKIGRHVIGGSGTSSGQVGSAGKTGSVTIGGTVIGGNGDFSGLIFGSTELGAVKIGRDLVGGAGFESGIVKLTGTTGKIGNVSIGGSIAGGAGKFSGGVFSSRRDVPATTTLGNVTVGGSVFGSFGEKSGAIFAHGAFGAVKIAHDLIGGIGDYSGQIENNTTGVKSVSLGGSLIGGSGYTSGSIELDNVAGAITVGGSIKGGGSDYTGYIGADNVLGGVMVRGSIIGPSVDPNGGYIVNSGEISIDDTKAIAVMGDLVGGSISGTADLTLVGMISAGHVGSILIGGSIIAGIDTTGNGDIDLESGGIKVRSVKSLTVKGSIVGNETSRAFITMSGLPTGTPGFALGKLTVGGSVEHTLIEVTTLGNASIGTVKVGGDWIASSLASGINRVNAVFGDGDDTLIAGAVSRIASITIGGSVIGTQVGGDSFAFTAHEIGSFKGAGRAIALTPNAIDGIRFFSAETGSDVTLRER